MSVRQGSVIEGLNTIGVSVWLDDLSRRRLRTGDLEGLIANSGVVGVTTNPTIFANALSGSDDYHESLRESADAGLTVDQAVVELMCADVRDACDLLSPTFLQTSGYDGRVSIEVPPNLAHDADATVSVARALWNRINRPNAMIKVPATPSGLDAIAELLSDGISVNVTLIFSLERYREVINAFFTGLERARSNGHDLSGIHSVASFFVSRLDTAIDEQLRALGSPEALRLCGSAAVANARLAYEIFEESLGSERAQFLQSVGANIQRPLWASTGVKDPELPDTLYVTDLAGPNIVNTMPEATLKAVIDHGVLTGDTLTDRATDANGVLNSIEQCGISYADTVEKLEAEGIDKFARSYVDLLDSARKAMAG